MAPLAGYRQRHRAYLYPLLVERRTWADLGALWRGWGGIAGGRGNQWRPPSPWLSPLYAFVTRLAVGQWFALADGRPELAGHAFQHALCGLERRCHRARDGATAGDKRVALALGPAGGAGLGCCTNALEPSADYRGLCAAYALCGAAGLGDTGKTPRPTLAGTGDCARAGPSPHLFTAVARGLLLRRLEPGRKLAHHRPPPPLTGGGLDGVGYRPCAALSPAYRLCGQCRLTGQLGIP